jgi:hypothetical protein
MFIVPACLLFAIPWARLPLSFSIADSLVAWLAADGLAVPRELLVAFFFAIS